jgi:U3 small nucleolar RNA-associated protein 18
MKRSLEELLEEKLFHKKEAHAPLDFHVETRQVRAWIDEADQDVEQSVPLTNRTRKLRKTESETSFTPAQLESRLRDQYKKLHPTPSWAEKRAATRMPFLTEVTPIQGDYPVLSPQFLDIVRLKDANISNYSKGVVEAVEFHPKAPVVLTAGLDRTIRLFHIDGKVNQKISSIFIKDLPILSAKFSVDGKEIYVSGKRKYFYVYHIDNGSMEKIPYIRGSE